jgi:hypothetical protein
LIWRKPVYELSQLALPSIACADRAPNRIDAIEQCVYGSDKVMP